VKILVMRDTGGGSWARWIVFLLSGALTLGCGDDGDDDDSGSDCGTTSNPDPFVITNVEPALGTTVPNAAIVHRFKIVGKVIVDRVLADLAATHTAGEPASDPTWSFTAEADGASYTASPITWTTAPGHVEVDFGGAYASPVDDCVLAFPSPMFSYEIVP
jgi:hypothetical protein